MSVPQHFEQSRGDVVRLAILCSEDAGEPAAGESDGAGASITVLTTDARLGEALREAVGAQHEVFVAKELEQANELAARGKCAILVTDQAMTREAFTHISQQLKRHEPALVTIAVGHRDQDNVFFGLMSVAAVDRFMLKPLTPAVAKIVVTSAGREHRSRQLAHAAHLGAASAPDADLPSIKGGGNAPPPAETVSRQQAPSGRVAVEKPDKDAKVPAVLGLAAEPLRVATTQVVVAGVHNWSGAGIQRPPWTAVLAAVVAVAGLVWWIMSRQLPPVDPRQVIAVNLSAAQTALAKERYIDPPGSNAFQFYSIVLALDPANAAGQAGIDGIADHFVGDATRLIAQGRFADAVNAIQSLRRVSPQHDRLSWLESELGGKLTRQFPQTATPTQAPAQTASAAQAPANFRSLRPPRALPNTAPESQGSQGSPAPMVTGAGQSIQSIQRDPVAAGERSGEARAELVAPDQAVEAAAPSRTAADELLQLAKVDADAALLSARVPAPLENSGQPVLLDFVQPKYPDEAHLRGIEGWVDLSFVVSAGGKVTQPRVEDSSMKHLFARPALNAVRQWRYEPRMLPADAPAQRTQVRVVFQLEEE